MASAFALSALIAAIVFSSMARASAAVPYSAFCAYPVVGTASAMAVMAAINSQLSMVVLLRDAICR